MDPDDGSLREGQLGFMSQLLHFPTDSSSIAALQVELQQLIEQARTACAQSTNESCAAAWDAVEEVQAALAHQRQAQAQHNLFDRYCSEHPDALECRVYDV